MNSAGSTGGKLPVIRPIVPPPEVRLSWARRVSARSTHRPMARHHDLRRAFVRPQQGPERFVGSRQRPARGLATAPIGGGVPPPPPVRPPPPPPPRRPS